MAETRQQARDRRPSRSDAPAVLRRDATRRSATTPRSPQPRSGAGRARRTTATAGGRDAAFTIQALLALGCAPEANAFSSGSCTPQLTHPLLHVLYRLDGASRAPKARVRAFGYRRASPCASETAATGSPLDLYVELCKLRRSSLAHAAGSTATRLGGWPRSADCVCATSAKRDAGISEAHRATRHFTESKMMVRPRSIPPPASPEPARPRGVAARRNVTDTARPQGRGGERRLGPVPRSGP